MTANLDLNDKEIINLKTDDKNIKSAANVGYVRNKVNTAKGDVTVGLKSYIDTKITESHITSSTNKQDVFRYLMENAGESSSENNIRVTGIVGFSGSPHTVNKKAYSFTAGKNAQNNYSSRIGFNMFKLSEGEYTLAIEFSLQALLATWFLCFYFANLTCPFLDHTVASLCQCSCSF